MSDQHSAAQRQFLADRSVGDVLDGTVVENVAFGTFVEVSDGVHGLVHGSEWDGTPAPGTPLRVTVLAVDLATGRLSLRPA